MWPDVPVTVSHLQCNRWVLASHSLLARGCWDTFRDTPTHAHKQRKTPDGLSLPGNEIPLTPPAEHIVLRYCMCEWKCSPRMPSEYSIILYCHSFHPLQYLYYTKKPEPPFIYLTNFSISHPVLLHIQVCSVWLIACPPIIILNKRENSQETPWTDWN